MCIRDRDVTGDGRITTFDIVTLRRLLLQRINILPNGVPSWKFVPKTYEFPNPALPFSTSFPDSIQVNNLDKAENNLDFVAIKIGDINLSASDFSSVEESQTRSTNSLQLEVEDQQLVPHSIITVPFKVEEFKNIIGYQLGLTYSSEVIEFVLSLIHI